MAIAADEEEVDLGQDYREPDTIAPQIQAAPVVPPGAAPIVAPPRNPAAPDYNPDLVGQNIDMRRMLNNMGDAPMAEAEQAVATAMKFQAIRGYQRDLANGIAASDALAKWAPVMFAQPKAGTLGQAASMVRATRAQQPKVHFGTHGEVLQVNPDGNVVVKRPADVPKKTYPMVVPTDPDNPMTGGHLTIPMDPEDPMVKRAIERARSGPPPPAPEPPGIISRIKDTIFGKPSQVAPPGPAPSSAPVPVVAEPSPIVSPEMSRAQGDQRRRMLGAQFGESSPATAVAPPSPVRSPKPTSPEEKLAAARALRGLHPDWTKKQILDAVNQ